MKTHITNLSVFLSAIVLLACSYLSALAQDMYHFVNETQYPIYLSRKVVLVQYKDRGIIESIPPSDLAKKANKIKLVEGIKGLAYITFPDGMSKADIDKSGDAIRKNGNIKSAHPMMTTSDGVEIAGFLDVLIVKLKTSEHFESFQSILSEMGLVIKDIDEFDKNIFYISGPSVLTNPIGTCNQLYFTKLLDFAQPNNLRYIKPAGIPADPLFSSQWGHTKMQIPEA